MNPTAPLSLTDRFVLPLEGLYAAVAARYRSGVMTIAMICAVCHRIRRVEQRVLKLLALFLAGTLPQETAPVARTRRKVEGEAGQTRVRIPRGFGWLIRMVPYQAAGYAGQLRLALADPEMMALLAASAKARRALAPVCRMLMIEPEVLAPTLATTAADEGAAAAVVADTPAGWPGLAPPDPPPAAPDFRYFRDGTRPQGPPLKSGP